MQRDNMIFFRTLGLALALAVGGLLLTPAAVRAQDAPQSDQTPGQVVQAFYDWYLEYIGTGEDIQNPLVTQAYHDSEYLTGDFVVRVDELLASFENGGYDPFLQAQAVPYMIVAGPVSTSDDNQSATVRAYTSFPNHILEVLVIARNGSWLIDDIARAEVESPEDVVGNFYTGYIGYASAGDEFRNPMLDAIYRVSPLVTDGMIAKADALLTPEEIIMADPFLCAQDIPTGFTIEPARFNEAETVAEVVLRTSFENHAVTVMLAQHEDGWRIADVACGEIRTPEGVARRFYAWYLAYNAWDGQGERPNALLELAFQDSDLLTADFKQRIERHLLDSSMAGRYDPLICAQDIPAYILFGEPELEGDRVTLSAETSFEGHFFTLELIQQGDQWRIDDVLCEEVVG